MDLNQDIDTLEGADDQDMLSEDFEDENDEERFEKLNEKNEQLSLMLSNVLTEIKSLQYQMS